MNTFLVSRKTRRGFTLIELLVAVGVTALLVSVMLGIVVNITNGWNRSSGSLEAGNQARLVLDQITSDLQAAILRRDSNVWMAASVQGASNADWVGAGTNTFSIPAGTPPRLEDYRFGPYGVWLRFFSTVPGANLAGDLSSLSAPRAVAYQIIRLPVVAGGSADEEQDRIRYQMFRSEVAPDVTFRVGYDLLHAKYNTTDDAGSIAIRNPSRANVIANNVVDFGVRIIEGTTTKFPISSSDFYLATTNTGKGTTNIGFPDTIEVFVRILSVDGSQQLANFEAGRLARPSEFNSDAEYWWHLVETNSRVYTRRVDLKAKGL